MYDTSKGCEIMIKDPAFGVDSFNKPKILNETQTLVNNILLILVGKPGFYPSQPTLGMDIGRYLYSLEGDINTSDIKTKLVEQCSDFLECIQNGDFDVQVSTYNNNPILLFILPTVVNNEYSDLVLGVTVSATGELVYNFTFTDNIGSI